MTTENGETTATAMPDPNVQSVDEFERSSLDAPEGVFRFRLSGNYGLMETKNGKKYLNALFVIDQQATYDNEGHFVETIDLKRPLRVFQKFFIETQFGTQRLNSWLAATGYETKGTFNPATSRYEFLKDQALGETIDKTAWNRVKHKKDEQYGWQLDLANDFAEKPQKRIKIT